MQFRRSFLLLNLIQVDSNISVRVICRCLLSPVKSTCCSSPKCGCSSQASETRYFSKLEETWISLLGLLSELCSTNQRIRWLRLLLLPCRTKQISSFRSHSVSETSTDWLSLWALTEEWVSSSSYRSVSEASRRFGLLTIERNTACWTHSSHADSSSAHLRVALKHGSRRVVLGKLRSWSSK